MFSKIYTPVPMEHHLPKVRFFCFHLTYDSRKLSWVVGKTSTGSKTESKILKGGHFMTNNVAVSNNASAKNKNEYIVFAALKLIEQLYRDGKIKSHIYENILKENSKIVDISQFALAS